MDNIKAQQKNDAVLEDLDSRVLSFETLRHPSILKQRISYENILYRRQQEYICDKISLTLYLKSELFMRNSFPGFVRRMREYVDFFAEVIRCLND